MLTRTQKDKIVKTFNLKKYLAYKRSIRHTDRSPMRIIKNGIPKPLHEKPDPEDMPQPQQEAAPNRRGKAKHTLAEKKLFFEIAQNLKSN